MHKSSVKDLVSDTRLEIELLLCCARTCLDSERVQRIKSLLQQNINWPYLAPTALRHGVTPLLCRSLNTTCAEAVPETPLDQLRKHFRANALRNFVLTRELLELLKLLEAHSIPAIPFKGPVIAAFAYGDPALRMFGDLDILVHKQDVLKAKELLISNGYQPKFQLTGAQEKTFLYSNHAYNFISEDLGFNVEIHWDITQRYFSFSFDPYQLWQRQNQISISGTKVPNLSVEDLLLILCVHGAKHRWNRLAQICDVAELLRHNQRPTWEKVMDLADKSGAKRMLYLGLSLARNLLGAPLPEVVLQSLQTDLVVKSLAEKVSKRLFNSPIEPPGELERIPFHLKTRERLRDRVRYVHRFLVTPTIADWKLLSLPSPLFFLYYVLRPIRLLLLQPILNRFKKFQTPVC